MSDEKDKGWLDSWATRGWPRYCVTVMDNWTPTRTFWSFRAAKKWRDKKGGHLYKRVDGRWKEIVGLDKQAGSK